MIKLCGAGSRTLLRIYIYIFITAFFFLIFIFSSFYIYIYILYRKAKKHNTLAKWRLLRVVKCKPNVNV